MGFTGELTLMKAWDMEYPATIASNKVDPGAIKRRVARRYTPRAIIQGRKREKLRKCVE